MQEWSKEIQSAPVAESRVGHERQQEALVNQEALLFLQSLSMEIFLESPGHGSGPAWVGAEDL